MLDVRTATDSGFEVRMIEDRGADCQLPLEQHRQPNVLLCAPRAKIAVVRIGVPNGGSRATTTASYRHAARPAFLRSSDPSAESLCVSFGLQ
jgi:hypothetical protein